MRHDRADSAVARRQRDGLDRLVLRHVGRLGSGALPGRPLASRRTSDRVVHRLAGLRFVHGLFPHAALVLRRAVHHLHAHLGHPRSRRGPRRLLAGARRHAGHVHHGLGQPPAHGLPGRRDGQRAVLRPGRPAQGPPQEQRSRAEVRRLRRRHGRHHALRHQPAGRRARLGPLAHHGHPPGRAAPADQSRAAHRHRHAHGAGLGRP